jgi:hypothetical protein
MKLRTKMLRNYQHPVFFCGCFVALCLFAAFEASVVEASTPRLSVILPRGVQRGHEHTIEFVGDRLSTTEEVFFYDDGMTALEIKAINDKKVQVKIKVDADCRLGEHFVQLRTKHGVSDYRSFHIGHLPGVAEKESNNDFETAQPIEQNVTIDGLITSGDVDVFSFVAKQGQRLSCEVQAMRLGQFFDSTIELYDAAKKRIAWSDDSALGKQDGFFSVTVPESGKYFVLVRDVEFGGSGTTRYRLHVGDFFRPAIVFPLGGQPGQKVELEFLADQGPAFAVAKHEVTLPGNPGDRLLGLPENLTSPTPLKFRINDLENAFEQPKNQGFTEIKNPPAAPIALNGRIEAPGDIDFYKFKAKKGKTYRVHTYARELGSGLDPVNHVYGPDKKFIRYSDDVSRKADCQLDFTASAGGDYYVRVTDHLGRGQQNFVYRIEITERQPELAFGIKRVDRYSQQRQTIAVPRGGRYAVLMDFQKQAYDGEVTLVSGNLPLGLALQAQPMRRGINRMPVVFEVDENAKLGGQLVEFKAEGKIDDENSVVGQFRNHADLSLGPPNNAVYYSGRVDKLAMAVVERLPFSVDLEEPKVPLVRNGQMQIPIVVNRDEGFDAPIRVEFPYRPAGIGARGYVTIPKGKSSGVYAINANSKALLGEWPICFIASANFKGPAWTASNLKTLEVGEPYVTAKIQRLSLERGQSGELICSLAHLSPFEGQATARILNGPPNVTIESEKKFTKDTKELRFKVVTTDKSPVGKHASLFCQVLVPLNGQQMVSRAANATILIKPVVQKNKQVVSKETP